MEDVEEKIYAQKTRKINYLNQSKRPSQKRCSSQQKLYSMMSAITQPWILIDQGIRNLQKLRTLNTDIKNGGMVNTVSVLFHV